MRLKFAKIISIMTVVPIMAFIAITEIYLSNSNAFNKLTWYIISLILLLIIPVSAYGINKVLSNSKNKVKDRERKLAFIMAVIGYTLGVILSKALNAPRNVFIIFFVYFLSGIILSFVNKVVKIKASGHACGVTTSLILLLNFGGIRFWHLLLILPIVYWARLTQKRHTFKELFIGTLIGVFSGLLAV